MKTAVVFRAHYITDEIRRTYRELREQATEHSVFMAFDATNAPSPALPGLFEFTQDELLSSDLHHESPWINGDHPLLLFRRANPDFDAYWMIEYDVRCTADWRKLLAPGDAAGADFLAAQVARYSEDPYWGHWRRSNQVFDRRHWRRSFFPVVRFSATALDVLEAEYRRGVTGFCEFVVPTILQRAGLVVQDLNDVEPEIWHSQTYRYRPIMTGVSEGPGLLRHPVREEYKRKIVAEGLERLEDTMWHCARLVSTELASHTVEGRDERPGPHRDLPGPFVVAGVGGSGTRLVADLLDAMGVDTGIVRPSTRDNLWFPVFFFRAMHLFDGIDRPREEEIYRRLRLFDEVTAAEYRAPSALAWQRFRGFAYAAARCRFHRWETIRHNRLLHELRHRKNWQRKSPSAAIAWGFKEPIAHVFLPQLAEHYPDLRFILVVRQPLAMASNPNQAQQRLWSPVFGVHGTSPAASMEYWSRANRRCLELMRQRLPGRAFILRYEDLCSNPATVIEALRKFLGAPPPSRDLTTMVQPSTRNFEKHRQDVAAADLERAESFFHDLETGPLQTQPPAAT